MSKSELSIVRILSTIFVILLCITTVGVIYLIFQLPILAENVFGESTSDLNQIQKISYSARLLMNETELTVPMNNNGQAKDFKVSLDEPIPSISQRLEAEGFIQDGNSFQLYLVYKGLDTGVQAGEYSLNPSMSAIEIAHILQDATPENVEFVILPGWRLEEIAASLPTSGLNISPEEFLQAARHPLRERYKNEARDLLANISENVTLEGYLLPGSYDIKRDSTVEDLLSIVMKNFYIQVFPEYKQEFKEQGFNLNEAVTLASITQREAVIEDEQSLITSVFINRLNQGMKLESDPTVQYALGYNNEQMTWWTNPISLENLEINSPYNTYLYPGLPPGPICSPGIPALKSVANSIETPYYYFRAACNGSGLHVFAVTYEDHVNNGCE